MLITLDESHRQLVHKVRDDAGEWLSTKGTDQYRGGLDMDQVHANIDHDFDTYPFVGWMVDGRVVAMMALIEPEAEFWSPEELAEPQVYISRFFVVEHGKGYGSALLSAVVDQAREQGAHWVRLNCWSTNTRLHDYYVAHGFEHVRTCDVAGRMSGALFQLRVDSGAMDDADLLAIVDDLMSLYDGIDSVAVEWDNQQVAQVAHGWYMRVRRTGEALVVLHSHGFGDEASPLRRSIIEHTVGLFWLIDAGESAIAALRRRHQQRVKKTSDNLGDGWSVSPHDLKEILELDLSPSPEETYTHFANQCAKYGSAEIFVAWLSETATSHPSLVSADSYVDEIDGRTVLIGESKSASDARGLNVFALLLLIASTAFNRFLEGQPWTDHLARLESRLSGL